MHYFSNEKRIDKKYIEKKIMKKLDNNKIFNSMDMNNKTITRMAVLNNYYTIFETFYNQLNSMIEKDFDDEVLLAKKLLDEIEKENKQN